MNEQNKKVPTVRFKGFTNDWEQRKLGDIVKFFSGLTYHPNDIRNKGCLVIRSSNIQDHQIVSADDIFVDNKIVNVPNVEEGDILVVVRNGSRKLIGKHAQVLNNMPNTVIGAFMTGLRSDNNAYINALLDSDQFQREIIKNLGATINQITTGEFKKMNFMVTASTESQKLGILFNKINKLITLQQRKLALLKQLKKGFLQKMFPKNGAKVPELRFAGFADAWEERKLKDVVEKQIKGKAQFEKLAPGEVEYLDTSRLNGGQAILTNGLKDVTLDDILILWDGSKAGTVYHGFEGALGSTLKAYRTSANSKFVYQYLKRHQDNIYNNYRTPNIPHVQKDFLNVFTISVPVSDEQEKIGSFFKQLDDTIDLQHQKLAKYQSVKKSLLQQMFI